MTKALKCDICKKEYASLAFQPFGPNESPYCITTLGSHYRGFPVIKICHVCADSIRANHKDYIHNSAVFFSYRGKEYCMDGNKVEELPF